jgi:hypothetical protein
MLLETVGEPFGPPLAVIATGAVSAGFSLPSSDVDLYVIVDQKFRKLDHPSSLATLYVDTTYYGAAEAQAWLSLTRDPAWPPPSLTRDDWQRHLGALQGCARFGSSVVLRCRDGWDRVIAECREPWLPARVAEWWRVEAIRRYVAAQWLLEAKPLLAAQRLFEAVLAALESRAAAAGQPYFGHKWLAKKLAVLGESPARRALASVTRGPTTGDEVPSYRERCEAILKELANLSTDGLAVQLRYQPGVEVRTFDGRSLVTRWNFRALEFRTPVPPCPEPECEIGRFEPSATLTPELQALFVGEMVWLSIIAAAR